VLDLSLLEAPDLVLAWPLPPDGHGGTRVGIPTVGEIDVEVGLTMDKNAEAKDLSG
jgi:hypothetical protein